MQHVLLLWQTAKSASETCVKFLQNPIELDLRVVEVSISLDAKSQRIHGRTPRTCELFVEVCKEH